MTRADRIRLAEARIRVARRLADLADEHYRIGDGLMAAAARSANQARRIAEGGDSAPPFERANPLISNDAKLR